MSLDLILPETRSNMKKTFSSKPVCLSTVMALFICLVTGHGLYKSVDVFTLFWLVVSTPLKNISQLG